MIKRLTALLLALLLAGGCLPASAFADVEAGMPRLLVSVLYENRTEDGQLDANVTIGFDRGSGPNEQEAMIGLHVEIGCLRGLECDQSEIVWDDPVHRSEERFTLHLRYKDPGALADPQNPSHRPALYLNITTLNCGHAQYRCVFDARAKARALVIYETRNAGIVQNEIESSAELVRDIYQGCVCQYQPVAVYELRNPIDWRDRSGLGLVKELDIDDNDITYIYIATHGLHDDTGGFYMSPSGTVSLMEDGKQSASIQKLVNYVKEQVKGRVVFMLDCCYSGQVFDEAIEADMTGPRYLFVSSAHGKYSTSPTTGQKMPLAKTLQVVNNADYYTDNDVATGHNLQSVSNILFNVVNLAVQFFLYTIGESFLLMGVTLTATSDLLLDAIEYISGFETADLEPFRDQLIEFAREPYSVNHPCVQGNLDLPILCHDPAYDDGYHPLVVKEDEVEVYTPVSVTGRVTDVDSSAPIEGAVVEISDPCGKLRLLTDADGRWSAALTRKELSFLFKEEAHVPERLSRVVDGSSTIGVKLRRYEALPAFYAYLRDTVVPEIGTVPSHVSAGVSRNTNFRSSLMAGIGGLVSAAVADFNDDGSLELLTVTVEPFDRYGVGYTLTLYGIDPQNGNILSMSRVSCPVYIYYEKNTSGFMAVHAQRSEGKIYLFADCDFVDSTADALSYRVEKIYTVEGGNIRDVTAFKAELEGNSGVSLHDGRSAETALCRAELNYLRVTQDDYTLLADYLADVESAQVYRPAVKNLADYAQEHDIDLKPIDRLVKDLESQTGSLVHVSTQTSGEVTTYNYKRASGVTLKVETRKDDGAIFRVTVDESKLYAYKDFGGSKQESFLMSEAAEETTELIQTAAASKALWLTAAERAALLAFTLRPTEYGEVREGISYTTVGSVAEGRANLSFSRYLHLVGAESNLSRAILELPQDIGTVQYGGNLSDTITWSLNDDGLLSILGTGDMPVFSKASPPPWDEVRDEIRRISVGEGITTVGIRAFVGCAAAEASLPASLTGIGSGAFLDCKELESVNFPETLEGIGIDSFRRSGLRAVELPDSLVFMGRGAFAECAALTELRLGAGLSSLPQEAFALCRALHSITLPESLQALGSYAFAYCGSLEDIQLNVGLTCVDTGVFSHCDKLGDVYCIGAKKQYRSLSILNENKPLTSARWHYQCLLDRGWQAIIRADSVLYLPGGLREIEAGAFQGTRAQAAVFPNSVDRIEEEAFGYSDSLYYALIPDGISSIGDNAFDADTCIICEEGSYARQWAEAHGCDVMSP